MVDFVSALATAAQALNLVKEMRGLEKSFDAAEFKLKIAELTEKLADLKITLSDAKQELADKQADITHLENLLSQLGDTIEIDGLKYLKNADGKPTGHPICSVCAQKEGLIFHTTSAHKAGRPEQCPNCKAEFFDVHVFF